jgi:hypothetical protein
VAVATGRPLCSNSFLGQAREENEKGDDSRAPQMLEKGPWGVGREQSCKLLPCIAPDC